MSTAEGEPQRPSPSWGPSLRREGPLDRGYPRALQGPREAKSRPRTPKPRFWAPEPQNPDFGPQSPKTPIWGSRAPKPRFRAPGPDSGNPGFRAPGPPAPIIITPENGVGFWTPPTGRPRAGSSRPAPGARSRARARPRTAPDARPHPGGPDPHPRHTTTLGCTRVPRHQQCPAVAYQRS